jgi:hypothetical protein
MPILMLVWGWLGRLGALLQRVPWQAWAVAGVLAAGWLYGHHEYARGAAAVQTRWDAERREVIGIATKAKAAAEEARRKRIARGRWILTELKRERDEAIAKGAAVAADVRAGRLRLREHWTCPALPQAGTAAAAGGGDADADLRAAGAGDLVRLGADADRLLQACQAVIRADREQVGG